MTHFRMGFLRNCGWKRRFMIESGPAMGGCDSKKTPNSGMWACAVDSMSSRFTACSGKVKSVGESATPLGFADYGLQRSIVNGSPAHWLVHRLPHDTLGGGIPHSLLHHRMLVLVETVVQA